VEVQGAQGSSRVVVLAATGAAEIQGAHRSSELMVLTKVDSVEPQGSFEAVFSTNVDSVEPHGSAAPWTIAFEETTVVSVSMLQNKKLKFITDQVLDPKHFECPEHRRGMS
jgi:hypothetical protein